MKYVSFFLIAMCASASAEEITQVIKGPYDVQTTVASPAGTTVVNTNAGHSIMVNAKDGSKIELDSDNAVYKVFPDGARASAPDGILTLSDGTSITVKDGKRIP